MKFKQIKMVKLLKLLLVFFAFLLQQITTNFISIDLATDLQQINVETFYTFTFNRQINPLTSDFVIPTTVPANSIIQIVFPSDYTTLSKTTTPSCNDAQTGLSLNCEITLVNRTVTIKNYYLNSSTTSNLYPSIRVDKIINPSKSGSTGNFQYFIKDSSGNIIDQSPSANNGIYFPRLSFTPGGFQACRISAQGATILTRSKLFLNLTLKNDIPSSGKIGLEIPLFWTNDMENNRTVASNPTCAAVANVSGTLSCSYYTMPAPVNKAYVTITGITSATLTSLTQISISIQSILTPPIIDSPDNILIYSQSGDGAQIDTCSTKVSDLTAIKFQSATFQSTSSTIVQSVFIGRLTLNIAKPFYYQDTIVFTLPSVFLSASVSTTSFGSISQSRDSSSSTITLSNFPTSASKPTNSQLIFTLQNITNPVSLKTVTVIASFYRTGSLYQQSSIDYTAVVGTAGLFELRPNDRFVNSKGICQIQIRSSYMIPAGSKIRISYPSTVTAADFSSVNTNSALLNGISVSGSTVATTSNTIILTNIFQSNFTNGTVLVSIPEFQNPPTVQPSVYLLTVQAADGSNIFVGSYTITANLKGLISNTISSSSNQVLSVGVITATLDLNFPATSITITLPNDIIVNPGFQTTCLPNTLLLCTLNGTNLTFQGNFQSGRQILSWGNTQNPNSFQPTQSFSVLTYNRGWGVEKSLGYIYLIMNQTAVFSSITYSPSIYKNNQQINIIFSIILPSGSPSTGVLSINFPTQIDISNSSCNVSCTKLSNKINFSLDNLTKIDINISNAINAPSFKPVQDFSFTYINSYSFDSLAMTKSSWTNNIPSSFVTTVSTGDAYRGENALFKFSVSGLSGKQTYVSATLNDLFGELATAPAGTSLLGPRIVRFNIINQTASDLYMTVLTPSTFGNYTFAMATYMQTNGISYLMGRSTSDIWHHSCFNTLCRACDSANISKCINCYSQSISEYYIFDTALTTCRRDCTSGFYLTNNGTTCSPCSGNCLQCANISTNCTSCDPSKSLFLDSNYKKCVSQCEDGYYANNQIYQCLICTFPCLYCNGSASKCTYCPLGRFLLNQDCLTNCPNNGQYISNSSTRRCDICNSNCLTCQNFTTICTSCNTSKLLYLQNRVCVPQCQNNSFIDTATGTCIPCRSPCNVCFNSSTSCLTCLSNTTTPYWYDYGCINSTACPLGRYINIANSSCDTCKPQCSACSSLFSCSSCAVNYTLYQNACIPLCPNTTYQSNRVCVPCTGCNTCNGSNLTCTSCLTNQFLYGGKCYDSCPNGTYNSTGTKTCQLCPSDCPTCKNATFCFTCIADLYLYLGKCYADCPPGAFNSLDSNFTPSMKICSQCPQKCSQCTSLTTCQSCKPSYNLQNDITCVTTCSIGLAYNHVCYPCGLNCSTCNKTAGKCTLCDTNYYVYEDKCLSPCPSTTLSLNGINCVSCSFKFGQNCTTCSFTECLSCSDGQLKDGQCKPCSQGTYTRSSKCAPCPSTCKSCVNDTYCISCNPNNYMQQNYCTGFCPLNKIPNGTKCSVCLDNCSICNTSNSLCSVCNSGYYLYESRCVNQCPSTPQKYVVNIDSTKCITMQQYYEEYSKAAKVVYFPFSIAGGILILIGIIIKCQSNLTNLVTLLCSVVSLAQIASWAAFLYVQYSAYTNYHQQSLKSLSLTIAAILLLIIIALFHIKFYSKYLSTDPLFQKWQSKNYCIDKLFLSLATIFNFKIYRIVHSRLLEREEFSMKLLSINKLIPFSLLSVVSLTVCSIPIIVGTSLALYFSIARDQEFFAALDCLIITSIMGILILIDLRHDFTYFFVQVQSSNLKRQMYEQDSFKLSINGQQGNNPLDEKNMSKAQLLQAYDKSALPQQSAMKLRGQSSITNNDLKNTQAQSKFKNTLNENHQQQIDEIDINNQQIQFEEVSQLGDQGIMPIKTSELYKPSQQKQLLDNQEQQLQDEQETSQPKQKVKWVQKQYDRNGYLIKNNDLGEQQLYDQNGYRVEIDQNTGQHRKFDKDGNQVQLWNDEYWIKDKDGFYVSKQGKKYDSRGYQVRQNQQTGQLEYFDEDGFRIVEDQNGNIKKYDKYGHSAEKDQDGKIRRFTQQGYEAFVSQNGKLTYKDKQGNFVRKNAQGQFQMYDPDDGFKMVKDSNGNITKYDKSGYRVQKDKWGNIYRYDQNGYRVVLGPVDKITKFDKNGYQVVQGKNGQIKLYDKDGYLVKFDENGKARFYDENGYLVVRDYDGEVTLFDQNGYEVVIDQKTGQHKKYTQQGLQVVTTKDGKKKLIDKRGKQVVELEDGYYEKYDELGNRVPLDEFGFQVQFIDDQMVRYDKVGNKVDEDQFQEKLRQQQKRIQQEGLGAVPKIKRFKNNKVNLDLQNQYSKMVLQQKQNTKQQQQLLEQPNLHEFHDSQGFHEKDFQQEYRIMKNGAQMNQIVSDRDYLELNQLQEVDHNPQKNIRQKVQKNRKVTKSGRFMEGDVLESDQNQDYIQMKSIADASINERSFDNQGVQPIDADDSQYSELQSLDQLSPNMLAKRTKRKRGQHSQMSYMNGQDMDTKTEYNHKKVNVEIKNKNIYDENEEIQSLNQQNWVQNAQGGMFYNFRKDLSNANTNTNMNELIFMEDVQDQADTLSSFMKQVSNRSHKQSPRNRGGNRYQYDKNTIEQMQNQLFQKQMDQGIRQRSEFKLANGPNPLVQYAKNLQSNKKSLQEKMYFEEVNKKKRRK